MQAYIQLALLASSYLLLALIKAECWSRRSASDDEAPAMKSTPTRSKLTSPAEATAVQRERPSTQKVTCGTA